MSFERIHRGVFFSFLCIIVLVSNPVSAHNESISQICEETITLDLGTTSRLHDLRPTDNKYYRIEVTAPGFVSLDVSAVGGSSADPVLMPIHAGCNGSISSKPFVLERTLASAVLGFTEAGDYIVRVASSHPSHALSHLKIQTGYSPYGEDEDEIESEPNPFADPSTSSKTGEDEDEIESEPNPFADPGTSPNVGEDEDEIESEPNPFAHPVKFPNVGEDEDEIESEPNPFDDPNTPPNVGEDEDEIESEPNPLADPGTSPNVGEDEDEIESEPNPFAEPGSVLANSNDLCSFEESDDHGDTFLCATVIAAGSAISGVIDNDWGDDSDVFRFMLDGSDLWRVSFSATGDAITGQLFNHHGQRLDRRELNNIGLVKVIPPGVYYIRITGTLGAEGDYRLDIDASKP